MDWPAHVGRAIARLGEDYVFTDVTGVSFSVRGVFSSPYRQSGLALPGIDSAEPRLECMSTDLSGRNLARATFTVAGVVYRVQSVESDLAQGSSSLILSKA